MQHAIFLLFACFWIRKIIDVKVWTLMLENHLLADGSVAGKNISILHHSLVGGGVARDLEDTAPLGKAAASLFVLGATLAHTIQTLCGALAVGAAQRHHALVRLDARDDALLLQHLNRKMII